MSRKKWKFRNIDKSLAHELAAECNTDPLLALILAARGYTEPYELEAFTSEDYQLSDPFELPNMEQAVACIRTAIASEKKIAVYGDYDADGITATALLYTYLQTAGCDVTYYIPERLEEGYGLHHSAIDILHRLDVDLIITVDNGISAIEEVAYANSLGMQVVITDHHRPGEQLPDAVAVVDPHIGMYDPDGFADYAGVGVAFKLVCALEECPCEELMPEYGDLLAIGTVADLVPLKEENRHLVIQGLRTLNRTKRIGLQELIFAADIVSEELTADQIAYGIAPRINAAGRMGDCKRAFELLITDDVNRAKQLAASVCEDNLRRQEVEAEVMEVCNKLYASSGSSKHNRVIVVAAKDIYPGVLGIVASRLCSKYGKPAIVLSVENGVATGSARSIEGFDLFIALSACSRHLVKFGGHTMAAGLTLNVEELDSFCQSMQTYACSLGERLLPPLTIDCKLSPHGTTEQCANVLRCLAPHGNTNPVPVFALMRMELFGITPVGGGNSLRLTLTRDNMTVVCMKFGCTLQEFPYHVGEKIDVAICFRYSTYKNRPVFSLVVQDIRPSELPEDFLEQLSLFESFLAGETLTPEQKAVLLPTRDELVSVFRYIRLCKQINLPLDALALRLGLSVPGGKIITALTVFEEFHFINLHFDGDRYHISLNPIEGKYDLTQSELLFKLQS